MCWMRFGADKPEQSVYPTREERSTLAKLAEERKQSPDYQTLTEQVEEFCCCDDNNCPARIIRRSPNWRSILTCPTLWCMNAAEFSSTWYSKLTAVLWPTFAANMLHLDTKAIGYIRGAKGFFLIAFCSFFATFTAKLAFERPFNVSLTTYRRLGQALATVSLLISASLLIVYDCSIVANIVSLFMVPLFLSFDSISVSQMLLDVAKDDSVLILSYRRLVCNGDAFSGPISSLILSYAPNSSVGNRATWRFVWLTGAVLKLISCLLFVTLAKAKQTRVYSSVRPKGSCRVKSALRQHTTHSK